MREYNEMLALDPQLRERYERAHYLRRDLSLFAIRVRRLAVWRCTAVVRLRIVAVGV